MRKKLLAVVMALVMAMSLLPVSALAVDGEIPGKVTATKTLVSNEPDADGNYTIKLTVQGNPVEKPEQSNADIVLVVDNSGSMRSSVGIPCTTTKDQFRESGQFFTITRYVCDSCGSYYYKGLLWDARPDVCTGEKGTYVRIETAKEVSSAFAEAVLEEGGNRLAVIGFSHNSDRGGAGDTNAIKVSQGLTDDLTAINQAIDKMVADGGTNYSAALQQAQTWLNGRADKTRPAYVVFISDGAPGKSGESIGDPAWDGSVQAKALKDAGVTVYTIGIALKDSESRYLRLLATDDAHYINVTGEDYKQKLQDILTGWATEINSVPAGTNAVLTDVVNTDKFTIVDSTGLTLAADGKTLTWDIGSIPSAVKEITFTIKPNEGVYGEAIPTNDNVELTYTDVNGESVTIPEREIGKPEVTIPAPSEPEVSDLSVTKTLESVGGQAITTDADGKKVVPKAKVGDEITWLITVKNTGNTTVKVRLSDSLNLEDTEVKLYELGYYTGAESPARDEYTFIPELEATFRAKYTVTAADKGKEIWNTVTATIDGDKEKEATADDPVVVADPGLSVTKTLVSVGNTQIIPTTGIPKAEAGDVIVWTITVENTGNTELTGVTVTDTLKFDGEIAKDGHENAITVTAPDDVSVDEYGNYVISSLAAGASRDITVTYTVTAADAGKEIVNHVVAAAGTTLADPDESEPVTVKKSAYSVEKTVDGGVTSVQVGEEIAWTITVKNEGNVPVEGIVLLETLSGTVVEEPVTAEGETAPYTVGAAGPNGTPITIASLAVDGTVTIPVTYMTKEEGTVVNTVVFGEDGEEEAPSVEVTGEEEPVNIPAGYFILIPGVEKPEDPTDFYAPGSYYPNEEEASAANAGGKVDVTTGYIGYITEAAKVAVEALPDGGTKRLPISSEGTDYSTYLVQPTDYGQLLAHLKAAGLLDETITDLTGVTIEWYQINNSTLSSQWPEIADVWNDGYRDVGAGFHVDGYVKNLPVKVVYHDNYTTGQGSAQTIEGLKTGDAYTILGYGATTLAAREGYTFTGWNTAADGSGTAYAADDVVDPLMDNLELYAQWRQNGPIDPGTYTVTYTDGVKNKTVFADQVYTDLQAGTATPAFQGKPTRSGYTFIGWEPTVADTVTADATYVAQWEKDDVDDGYDDGDDPGYLNTKDHFSYIIGYKDGTLRPNGNITRGEVATIFFRLLTDDAREDYWSQTNKYTDVAPEKWCNNAISTLSSMGIIDGYLDGTFRPDGNITRAEFAKMAVNFFDYTVEAYQGYFPDVDEDAWYAGYVEAAKEMKLIEGYIDGSFQPDKAITRAEACTIVNRTLGRVPDKDHLLPVREMETWPDCSRGDWFYEAMMEATNSHNYTWVTVNGEKIENWTEKEAQRDWAALENTWSTAHSAPGGEVVR